MYFSSFVYFLVNVLLFSLSRCPEILVFYSLLPPNCRFLAPFLVVEYIPKDKGYPDSRRFASIPIDGPDRFVYDLRFRVNEVTALGAWLMWWAHWDGRGAALRVGTVTLHVCLLFIKCTEECSYVTGLAAVMAPYASLRDVKLATHRWDYVASLCLFERYHLLIRFNYWLKETVFERRF